MIATANLLLAHLPHIAPMALGVLAFVWLWYRSPPSDATPEEQDRWLAERDERRRARRQVRRAVASRGLVALGPLFGALATGAVIYGIELSGARPAGAWVWIHVGVCLLVAVLAAYKLLEVGAQPLRDGLRPAHLLGAGASLAFSALLVPVTVSGVVLIAAPSSRSFPAYAHLITGAWWTVLLLWHLRRYLVASVLTVRTPADAPAAEGSWEGPIRRGPLSGAPPTADL